MESCVSKIGNTRRKGEKSTTGIFRMINSGRKSCPANVASTNTARKSCLLPPNSVRDRYICNQAKESIVEQSSTDLCPETRPSVIMTLTASTVTKNRLQSASSEGSVTSDYSLSHPPLQVLNKNSSMPVHRIDAKSTSLEDLLGNSAIGRRDQRTLRWFRRNLIYSIESTEKTLFSLKQMLRVIENTNNTDATVEKESLKTNTDCSIKSAIEAAPSPKNRDNGFLIIKPESNSSPVRRWLRLP